MAESSSVVNSARVRGDAKHNLIPEVSERCNEIKRVVVVENNFRKSSYIAEVFVRGECSCSCQTEWNAIVIHDSF